MSGHTAIGIVSLALAALGGVALLWMWRRYDGTLHPTTKVIIPIICCVLVLMGVAYLL